ncbi:hypothetical protein SAMN04515679_3805 [Pelosinus fermentans]|jgi:hypothetical protein|uniref:Holin-like toxin n=1 Tax=Pelosinus fermentans B4 TaxID=1149862 RepID=I9ATS5_9FIRM|nr:hypothetical protein FB4_0848 [Pelosinus fermentans B4]EIW22683.1 hypothetical protein FA11_0266 [Pelosinus fermentans A11]OAM95644.1 hypothetical protein FR7_03665 [Pelosinus fermentans DSM 17108]SDR30985.1 hypothetical protein SAMN04515679_3805 [Pelosinus fermentans]
MNKPETKFSYFRSGNICYNKRTDCLGVVSHSLVERGGMMISMFEAMYLMIAFATLVVLIINRK